MGKPQKTFMFEPPGAQNVRDAYETYMTSDTYVLFFLFEAPWNAHGA